MLNILQCDRKSQHHLLQGVMWQCFKTITIVWKDDQHDVNYHLQETFFNIFFPSTSFLFSGI